MKKKLCAKILALLLVFAVAGGLWISQPTQVQAATKSAQVKKIKKSYANYLKKYAKGYKFFTVLDVNRDGYPELICMGPTISNKDWRIYTYYKGKIQRVRLPYKNEEDYTIRMFYNSGSKSLYFDYSGSAWMGDSYTLKGNKLVHRHSFYWYHEYRKIDRKPCSLKTMEKWYNHYSKLMTLKQNTSANRTRYLLK